MMIVAITHTTSRHTTSTTTTGTITTIIVLEPSSVVGMVALVIVGTSAIAVNEQ